MIEYVKGDLFDSGERVIAHGCNCMKLMGAGVAGIVARRYPLVKEKYIKACEAGVFNLGYAQFVVDDEHDICVYNLATQIQPGANGSRLGIYLSFANMFQHAIAHRINRIAMPMIGAGIAGLNWEDEVVPEIEQATALCVPNIRLVVYQL